MAEETGHGAVVEHGAAAGQGGRTVERFEILTLSGWKA